MCFKRIARLFRKPKKEIKEEKPEKPPRKWWQFPFKVISASRGGFNMPKHQPCPKCHGGAKRKSKTMGGAYYWCNRDQEQFFVRR